MNAASLRALAVCLATGLAIAQTASFDVATLKFRKGPIMFSADPAIRGRTVTGVAITLRDLVTYAYAVRYDQLSAVPGWAADDHYDLLAKSEGEGVLTLAESRQMMQALLADRFQLRVHRETREVPMYALVVAKGGPKLKLSAPDATGGCSVRGDDTGLHMECKRGSMEQLARQLAGTGDRFVVDRTGLTDRYVFRLDWWPANRPHPPDSDVPSMFDALQEQVGLRLEPTRGPLEMLVVDQVAKPSEN